MSVAIPTQRGTIAVLTRLPGHILLARLSLLLFMFSHMFRDLLPVSSVLTVRGLCDLSAVLLVSLCSNLLFLILGIVYSSVYAVYVTLHLPASRLNEIFEISEVEVTESIYIGTKRGEDELR